MIITVLYNNMLVSLRFLYNMQKSLRVCYIALPFNRVRLELCLNVQHMEQIAEEVLCSFGDSDEELMLDEGELA